MQIREIDGWWTKNRPTAVELFLNELSEAFEVIAGAPQIGSVARTARRRASAKGALSHDHQILAQRLGFGTDGKA